MSHGTRNALQRNLSYFILAGSAHAHVPWEQECFATLQRIMSHFEALLLSGCQAISILCICLKFKTEKSLIFMAKQIFLSCFETSDSSVLRTK